MKQSLTQNQCNVLRDVHLGEDPGVIHQGPHAPVGGLTEEREHEVAAEKELIGFTFLERGLAVSFHCFIYAFAIVPIVKSKKLVDALPIQWFQFAAVFHVFDDFGNGLI